MSSMAFEHAIGDFLYTAASGAGTATAAGAGDATEVDGAWVDRRNLQSCLVVIAYKTSLTAAKTLSFAMNLQDATDSSGTGAADFGDALAATVVKTGALTAAEGTLTVAFDLAGASQYVRTQVTPDLSHSGTDTVVWAASLVFPKETV